MSAEPPFSDRPTGPPSGPLSGGPSQPPTGPPVPPTGGAGTGEPHPHRPWWRSVPRIAALTAAVVAVAVLAVVLTRPDGGSGKGGEIFPQAAGSTGPDPFTPSTATTSSVPPVTVSPAPSSPQVTPSAPAVSSSGPVTTVRGVNGASEGLYSGTRNVPACDVNKQSHALQADPAKNRAWASAAGVQPSGVPAYLHSLTPVQLRADTRVTNHGYRDGAATHYQSVLQAGTAVLVDGHGVPRVRCACGNPLAPPVAQKSTPKLAGHVWPSYRPSNVVVVTPAPVVIKVFVIYDPHHHGWFHRHRGDTGHKDQQSRPPARPFDPNPPSRPPECASSPGQKPPCPPPSRGPESPSSETPSSGTSSSENLVPPSSDTPSSDTSSDTSSSDTPSSENLVPPSSETPSSDNPSSDNPSSDNPSSDTPSSDTPSSDNRSSDTPSSDMPSSETPSSQNLVPPSSGSESTGESPTSEEVTSDAPEAPMTNSPEQ
ncbi:DUF6777 domain-containing protein [Streptomyces sp. NPDC051636]|uniref:DUF6777 domain-containing protein n=1 Tax=Streptomyces sp. NPDC051636 TaxID=3365663 RepID=UPI00379F7E2A